MLPEFVFLKAKALDGTDYIIETNQPFNTFRVFWFSSAAERESFIVKHNVYGECAKVPFYNILLCYVGPVDKADSMPVKGLAGNIPEQVKESFPRLLKFYQNDRINGNESRLKKWLE